MNKTALLACFASLAFRCRLHAALVRAAKLKKPTIVKNRKGKNLFLVTWNKINGFTFIHNSGKVIPKSLIYSLLQKV